MTLLSHFFLAPAHEGAPPTNTCGCAWHVVYGRSRRGRALGTGFITAGAAVKVPTGVFGQTLAPIWGGLHPGEVLRGSRVWLHQGLQDTSKQPSGVAVPLGSPAKGPHARPHSGPGFISAQRRVWACSLWLYPAFPRQPVEWTPCHMIIGCLGVPPLGVNHVSLSSAQTHCG